MNETMIKAIKLTDDFGADIWFVLDKIVLLKKGRYGGTVIYTVDGHSELVKEEVKEVIDEIERIESSKLRRVKKRPPSQGGVLEVD